jgi:hypothetical protein
MAGAATCSEQQTSSVPLKRAQYGSHCTEYTVAGGPDTRTAHLHLLLLMAVETCIPCVYIYMYQVTYLVAVACALPRVSNDCLIVLLHMCVTHLLQ